MDLNVIGWLLLVAVLPAQPGQDAPSETCAGYPAALVVDTARRTMVTCRDRRTEGTFRVSLGRGGIDKRARGDRKTPLGEYDLGTPRSSARYGLFIPIGYPKPEQKANGRSGGDIGIHGPHREFLWLGKDSTDVDWTLGCIAVGTDEEIVEVARWVQEHNVTRVIIR